MNVSPAPRRAYPSDDFVYAVCWAWSGALSSYLSHTRVHFSERIPETGPLLVAANHSSFLDPVYVGAMLTRPTRYMAKNTLFKRPFGGFLRRLGAFPVRRGEPDAGAIRTAMRVLKQGDALVMFPEGTRAQTDEADLREAQKGVGFLATRMGAVVVPVYVHGLSEVLGRGQRWFRRGQVDIVVGEPRRYAREDDPGEAAAEVVAEIARLRASIGSLRLDRSLRVG